MRRKAAPPGQAPQSGRRHQFADARKADAQNFCSGQFPYGLARELRNYKIKVRVKKGGVFPQREFKRADEIKKSAPPS